MAAGVVSHARGPSSNIDLHDLSILPRARLRARWLETFGKKPSAAFGRELLALGIAYEVQEKRLAAFRNRERARSIA